MNDSTNNSTNDNATNDSPRPVFADRNRYKIVRSFRDTHRKYTIATNLTLEEAQAHCRDKETSSSTATSPAARKRTRLCGPWFDGYQLDN